jgi:hypothetical protein
LYSIEPQLFDLWISSDHINGGLVGEYGHIAGTTTGLDMAVYLLDVKK